VGEEVEGEKLVVGAISGLCDYGGRFSARRGWEWGLQRDTIATNNSLNF
jgi:hypothetical protein